jgi:ABC-type Fe3+/spermidine/putrescine transport system ATPase subunit
VAYGLKARRVGGAEIAARVRRALELVQLPGYETRWPHQLSGGQLQRVAIARCLVIEPAVLLLDEPLSNLDARLRIEMRAEIRALQKSLGITAIYVTHDQEEALAISDRIAVMRAGRLAQIDAPAAIYRRPRTPFVAGFMGAANLLSGPPVGRAGPWTRVRIGDAELLVGDPRGANPVTVALRPEALRLVAPGAAAPAGWATLAAQLAGVEFLGALTRLRVMLAGGTALTVATLEMHAALQLGQTLTVAYDPADAVVLDADPVDAG